MVSLSILCFWYIVLVLCCQCNSVGAEELLLHHCTLTLQLPRKDSSPKWPIMCRARRTTLLTHSLVSKRQVRARCCLIPTLSPQRNALIPIFHMMRRHLAGAGRQSDECRRTFYRALRHHSKPLMRRRRQCLVLTACPTLFADRVSFFRWRVSSFHRWSDVQLTLSVHPSVRLSVAFVYRVDAVAWLNHSINPGREENPQRSGQTISRSRLTIADTMWGLFDCHG